MFPQTHDIVGLRALSCVRHISSPHGWLIVCNPLNPVAPENSAPILLWDDRVYIRGAGVVIGGTSVFDRLLTAATDQSLVEIDQSPVTFAKRVTPRTSAREAIAGETHCHYCKRRFDNTHTSAFGRQRTVDHKIPRSKGGTSHISNLIAACANCNRLKADESYESFVARRGWGDNLSAAEKEARRLRALKQQQELQPRDVFYFHDPLGPSHFGS